MKFFLSFYIISLERNHSSLSKLLRFNPIIIHHLSIFLHLLIPLFLLIPRNIFLIFSVYTGKFPIVYIHFKAITIWFNSYEIHSRGKFSLYFLIDNFLFCDKPSSRFVTIDKFSSKSFQLLLYFIIQFTGYLNIFRSFKGKTLLIYKISFYIVSYIIMSFRSPLLFGIIFCLLLRCHFFKILLRI